MPCPDLDDAVSNGFLLAWAERALREDLGRFDPQTFEIFGQGSRVNGTHLDHTADIDLVLMLKQPLSSGWEQFRDDVLTTLGESHTVRMGRRCLNVDDPDSLFGEMVDVLVATEFRWFPVPGDSHYEQGVFFRDLEGRPIVNFPKQHRRNGDAKDRRTGGRFKQAVRSAKRARREHPVDVEDVPPYLIECLLFNVPDRVYLAGADHRDAAAWLRRAHRDHPVAFAGLPCQNGINRIFGPGPDQWEPGAAARIIDVLQQI
ncbi:nucleotidyltransferase [Actinoplanes sichuanensis]|nr:nucleotidyltransferase [Actinoplanes sichuanensis]